MTHPVIERPVILWYDSEYDDTVIVRMPRQLFLLTQQYTPFEVEEMSSQANDDIIASESYTMMQDLLRKRFGHA